MKSKTIKLILLLLLGSSIAYAQIANFELARRMGGAGSDEGQHIAVDASGNIYTTGSFEGTADFDPGCCAVLFVHSLKQKL